MSTFLAAGRDVTSSGQTFAQWVSARVGGSWIVADRPTHRMREKGHVAAIPMKEYNALHVEFEREVYGAPLDSMIDAAPEMLQALRAFLKYSESTADTSDRCVEVEDAARAAIGKAEGR